MLNQRPTRQNAPSRRLDALGAFRFFGLGPLSLVLLLVLPACDDAKSTLLTADQIWDGEVITHEAQQPITFADRADGASYGLPRPGEPGIADLIAIYNDVLGGQRSYAFAQSVYERGDPPLQECRFDGATTSTARLPLTFEGVVTYHPRRFFKVEVCAAEEDERNWGAFTVEDDTGGILVLRLGRTTNFSFGDRVRITVTGIMLTFSRDSDTRAILSYTMEKLSGDSPDQDMPILYEEQSTPFVAADVGRVHQIEGFVNQSPNNANFNTMLLSDVRTAADPSLFPPSPTRKQYDCLNGCVSRCRASGCTLGVACDAVCRSRCVEQDFAVLADYDTPTTCWSSNIDIDLGRRGFTVEQGARIQATGPVINNFDRQLWVYSPNQVQILAPAEAD